jgi:hypothetical protein
MTILFKNKRPLISSAVLWLNSRKGRLEPEKAGRRQYTIGRRRRELVSGLLDWDKGVAPK